MTQEYHGSFISIQFDANELSTGPINIQLADGYTYERIYIHYIDNIELLMTVTNIMLSRLTSLNKG